jgi:predicted amidophosphoribosyltransferase
LPDAVERIDSLWRFDGPVADVLEYAKYRGELWRLTCIEREVAGWLGGIVGWGPIDLISVPPGRRRLRERGFDLPRILVGFARSFPGARDRSGALRRRFDAPRQSVSSRTERFEQVEGAFVAKRLSGRPLLLIDDVLTTGATACACVTALALAGARDIRVATLARTPRRDLALQ